MKLMAAALSIVLIGSSTVIAATDDAPIQRSAARAVKRAASAAAQTDVNGESGHPYRTPAIVMAGAGVAVAVLASKVPKLRTQTQGYDACAQANGVATGPSNY